MDKAYRQTFDELITELSGLEKTMKVLTRRVRELKKDLQKDAKEKRLEFNKVSRKARGLPARPRSGIHKPCRVSPEFLKFLNKPDNTLLARTDATRLINEIIKKEGMQSPEAKRNIVPTPALRQLLAIPEEKPFITFFELPKLMNQHFIKDPPAEVQTGGSA